MTRTSPESHQIVRRRRITAEPLGHIESLDGLRAVAVIGVLLYHARFSWLPGGFLGVSTFFTLSGFLITSLLLREWSDDGSVDLRKFWVRRFRRLLPASWVTLGLIVAMGAAGVWNTDQLRAMGGDVPFALLQVVNWHFILAGRSYGEAFTAPSPVEHYWSLAVEQQVYLVLPVLVAGVLSFGSGARRGGRRLRRVAVVLAAATLASVALNGVLASGAVDRSYFGTDTRMAEVLVGALLACATLRRLRFAPGPARSAATVLGLLGLGGTIALWSGATLSSRWMYPWGLLLTAVCSAALLLGAVQEGPLGRLLAVPPLRFLGRISYGVYLLHWPVFLWLSPARLGWSQWPLFALRLAVTFLGATLMLRLVEDPIRRGGRLVGRRAVIAGVTAGAVVLVGTVAVRHDLPDPGSLSRASAAGADRPPTTPPPPPLRTVVVGDVLAESLATGLRGIDGFEPSVSATPGCGLTIGGYVARSDDTAERDVDRCSGERERWIAEVEAFAPDVVVVHGGLRDLTDRRLRPESGWAGPGDPAIDEFLTIQLGELVDGLSRSGGEVVLLAMPRLANSSPPPPAVRAPAPTDPTRAGLEELNWLRMTSDVPPGGFRENDPARVDRFNQVMMSVAAARGLRFLVPGTDAFGPGADPATTLPGGEGYRSEDATQIAQWLLPELRNRVETPPPADTAPRLDPNAPLPPAPVPVARRQLAQGATPKVLVVGDSVGHNVGSGLEHWSDSAGGLRVDNAATLGCPVARGGAFWFMGDLVDVADTCDWAGFFPDQLNAVRPHVVVLSSGIWEVVDRRLPGDDAFRHIGDPGVDRYLVREFLTAVDVLSADGARVVVLTQPHFQAGLDQGFQDLPESDPARTDRLNELLREVVRLRPEVATLVDLQGWLASQPGGEIDPEKRPDGLHFTDAYLPTLGAWVGPQLIDLARS